MSTAATEKRVSFEFTIQADHPRNSDLLLQTIPNCRLRGTISSSRTVRDRRSGEEMVPIDQAAGLGSLPLIPGMKLKVSTKTLSYIVEDPLYGDDLLCERIQRHYRTIIGSDSKVRGVPPQPGKLDEHRMKTLVRECRNIVNANEAKIVEGILPELDEIDLLPGRVLLNPGLRTSSTQPRFEDEWDSWFSRLQQVGG